MAKKEKLDKIEEINDLNAQINKEFGHVVKPGSELLNREVKIISVSPAHDLALGGGIPQGSWVTISGKPKTGKSITSLYIASKCQQAGMEVYYGNVEGRLKKRDLQGIKGIDLDKFYIIESSDEKFMTAIDYLETFQKILKQKKQVCLIIDSVSMLADENEISGGIGTSTRGGGAKFMAQFCRNNAGTVPVKSHIVIGILQMMANTSGYGSPYQEKGGNSIVFQADVRLSTKSIVYNEVKGKTVGATVNWNMFCSALNSAPAQQYESQIRYGVGIDEPQELVSIAETLDIIQKGGAWYTIYDKKFQGIENVREYVESNPEVMKKLEKDVKELIG